MLAAVFAYTFLDNVVMKPDGLLITGGFIVAILALGALSRSCGSLYLRVSARRGAMTTCGRRSIC